MGWRTSGSGRLRLFLTEDSSLPTSKAICLRKIPAHLYSIKARVLTN